MGEHVTDAVFRYGSSASAGIVHGTVETSLVPEPSVTSFKNAICASEIVHTMSGVSAELLLYNVIEYVTSSPIFDSASPVFTRLILGQNRLTL